MPLDTLTRSLVAGRWSLANTLMQRGLSFLNFLVLARLLVPNDFGVVALVGIVPGFLDLLTALPFDNAALIRREGLSRYLNPIWTFNVIRSVLLFVILFFVAPYIAHFFHIEYALTLVRLGGLALLIQGFVNIGQIYFSRDLDFRRVFLRDLSGQIAYVSVSICGAFILHSYWALFLGAIAQMLTTTLATYVLHPYRPRLTLHLRVLGELRSFGQWLFGQSMLQQVSKSFRDSLVGRYTSPAAVGIFSKAQVLADGPMGPLLNTINSVSFMSYLRVRESAVHVVEGVSKTFDLLVLIAFPYLTLILLSGAALVHALLGDAWLAMTPYLKILSIEAVLEVLLVSLGVPVFNALGESKLQFVNQSVRTGTLIIALILLVPTYGIWGAAIAMLISVSAAAIIVLYNLLAKVRLNLGRMATSAAIAIIASVMPMPLAFLLFSISFFNGTFGYLLVIALCGALYAGIIIAAGRVFGRGPYPTLEVVLASVLHGMFGTRRLDFLFSPRLRYLPGE